MSSKEGPWPFSEEEWREVLEVVRDTYGVAIQEDGSVLISPYGQSILGAYLIFTLFLVEDHFPLGNPGYDIVIFLMLELRLWYIRR